MRMVAYVYVDLLHSGEDAVPGLQHARPRRTAAIGVQYAESSDASGDKSDDSTSFD